MDKQNAKRQPTESEMETVQLIRHTFKGGAEFESEALSTYADVLKGLKVSDADTEKLLETFHKIIRDVTDSKGSYDPFISGIIEMRRAKARLEWSRRAGGPTNDWTRPRIAQRSSARLECLVVRGV